VLLPIGLMLVKTIAELNMAKGGTLYTLLEFIGNPITAMFIAVFVAYYLLGIRQHMGMGTLLTHTENGFGSIANILLIIGAGGAFNAILKTSGLADTGGDSVEPAYAPDSAGLAGGADSACRRRLRHRRDDGRHGHRRADAAALSGVSPEIIAIAIGSGAIGCTIVTDSLFWLVKQYCGASLNETFKYYTTATFIASVLALAAHSCFLSLSERKET
jgi:D-serine transporter